MITEECREMQHDKPHKNKYSTFSSDEKNNMTPELPHKK